MLCDNSITKQKVNCTIKLLHANLKYADNYSDAERGALGNHPRR